jgi:beta-glucosidase
MPTILDAVRAEFPRANVTFMIDPGTPRSNLRREFTRLARAADVILAVVGEWPYTEFIGDINDLTIDSTEVAIMETVIATGKPHAVILVEGRPRVLPGNTGQAQAILFAGLPGQEGAPAIAHILSGKVNPSGRLSFTYPKYPSHFSTYDHKATDHPTHMWPFAHGLSYTTFAYSNLTISQDSVTAEGSLVATVTVQNTGSVAGKHAVIWFLIDEFSRITRPVRKLGHFDKAMLEPGESRTFTFEIQAADALWFPDERGRKIFEPGRFFVQVGDLRTQFVLKLYPTETSVRR